MISNSLIAPEHIRKRTLTAFLVLLRLVRSVEAVIQTFDQRPPITISRQTLNAKSEVRISAPHFFMNQNSHCANYFR